MGDNNSTTAILLNSILAALETNHRAIGETVAELRAIRQALIVAQQPQQATKLPKYRPLKRGEPAGKP